MDTAKKLIAHVDEKLTKAHDIRDISLRYTCDMISNSIFNVDAHSFSTENPEIFKHCNKIMTGITGALSSLMPKQMFPTESAAFFKRLLIDAIGHKNDVSYKRDDFLTHILASQQKKNLSVDEMLAQTWTIFMESFETSGIALSFMLYELSKNQKIQDKLRKEILENLNDDDNLMRYETMMELQYLDQVFHETLRLHTPLMITTKVCSENYEIEGSKGHKFQMQKGDVALISMYSIHRDPGMKFYWVFIWKFYL